MSAREKQNGVAVIYVGFAIVVIIGIMSLTVDIGRIRVAKGQLQTAADAAAMGAALTIPNIDLLGGWNFNDVDQTAINLAVANKITIDSVAATLVPATDIEYGTWNKNSKTFTHLGWGGTAGSPGDARQGANAVRIYAHRTTDRKNPLPLTVTRILNLQTQDLNANATAFVEHGPTQFGIVGLTSVDSNGNGATIDSYDPSAGPYGGSNVLHNANTASNGDISLGNGDVYGDCRPGPGHTLSQGPNSIVTGWTAPLDAPLVYAPVTMPSGLSTLPNGKSPIAGGIYQTSSFPGGNLTFTGPVTVYVTGSITVKNNTTINTYLNLPANLQIFVVGSGGIDIQGGGTIYAHLYAPSSDIDMHGNGNKWYGSIIANSISFKGTADIHYDQSQGIGNTGYQTYIVQ